METESRTREEIEAAGAPFPLRGVEVEVEMSPNKWSVDARAGVHGSLPLVGPRALVTRHHCYQHAILTVSRMQLLTFTCLPLLPLLRICF